MSNANPSFLGQVNAAGDKSALFLKVFAGEVLTAYNTACKFKDKHRIRQIKSGKSAQFPATGKTTANYHTPGTEILGQPIKHNEQVIIIDDVLISDVFVSEIDELKNHYDVRAPYTEQLGQALAKTYDQNVAQVGVLAARATNPVTGLPGGSSITAATLRTDSVALGVALFQAAEILDSKDIPETDRFAYVLPAQYYLAVQNKDLINKDYAGLGSIAKGTIESIAGLTIVKTNNLPVTNITTGPSKYQGDFSKVAFLVMNREAVGTVQLMDLAIESERDIRRQGTLILAKYAVGHGILRPNCAVEGKIA